MNAENSSGNANQGAMHPFRVSERGINAATMTSIDLDETLIIAPNNERIHNMLMSDMRQFI